MYTFGLNHVDYHVRFFFSCHVVKFSPRVRLWFQIFLYNLAISWAVEEEAAPAFSLSKLEDSESAALAEDEERLVVWMRERLKTDKIFIFVNTLNIGLGILRGKNTARLIMHENTRHDHYNIVFTCCAWECIRRRRRTPCLPP